MPSRAGAITISDEQLFPYWRRSRFASARSFSTNCFGHQPKALSAIARIYQKEEFSDDRRDALEAWGKHLTAAPTAVSVLRAKTKRGAALGDPLNDIEKPPGGGPSDTCDKASMLIIAHRACGAQEQTDGAQEQTDATPLRT